AASRPGRRWRRFCPSWRPAAGSRFRSAATWPPFCRVLPTFPSIVLLTLPLRRGLPGSSSTPLFELRSQLLDLCPFRRRRTTHTCSSFTLLLHHQIHSWNRWFPLTLTVGYTIGGPVLLPRSLKTTDKLFFFWSQEFQRQLRPNGANNRTVPTALERKGDFSQSVDNNGNSFTNKDPSTGSPFSGNVIPASSQYAPGIKLLSFASSAESAGR